MYWSFEVARGCRLATFYDSNLQRLCKHVDADSPNYFGIRWCLPAAVEFAAQFVKLRRNQRMRNAARNIRCECWKHRTVINSTIICSQCFTRHSNCKIVHSRTNCKLQLRQTNFYDVAFNSTIITVARKSPPG